MHLDQDLGASSATVPQSRSASTSAASAPSSALSTGSPQTREDLAKLLEGMEFGSKITKLEITLSISIQVRVVSNLSLRWGRLSSQLTTYHSHYRQDESQRCS
jgi:hypothetical protein